MPGAQDAIFDIKVSDFPEHHFFVSAAQMDLLFDFFRTHPLFRWQSSNNDCEDRADAICRVLDAWNIPNVKAPGCSAAQARSAARASSLRIGCITLLPPCPSVPKTRWCTMCSIRLSSKVPLLYMIGQFGLPQVHSLFTR